MWSPEEIAELNRRFTRELTPCEIVFKYPELASSNRAVKSNFGGKYYSVQALCDAAKKDLKEGRGPLHPTALKEIPVYLKKLYKESRTKATLYDVIRETVRPSGQYGVGYDFMHYYRNKLLAAGGLPEPLVKIPCKSWNEFDRIHAEKARAAFNASTFCIACLRRLGSTSCVTHQLWQGNMWVYAVHHHTCETFMASLFRRYEEQAHALISKVNEIRINTRWEVRRLTKCQTKKKSNAKTA